MLYMVITGVMTFIGMYINRKLQGKFKKYNQVYNPQRKTGAQIAKEMLDHYGIHDVQIMMSKGMLTDHYNPLNKTVNLSEAVYRGQSVMSAAVAAHEVGHAVQHAQSYAFLKFRSAMVPFVKAAANVQQYLLMFALLLIAQVPQLLLVVLISFFVTTAFAFMTLPVEFDASKRAVAWLESTGTTFGDSAEGARDALKWAGMTYVAAALSSLAMLLFLLLRYMGSRD